MTTYTSDELISSTDMVRKFSLFLSQISTGRLEKIGIIKNSKVEAVILPIKEYESMVNTIESIDNYENEVIKKYLSSNKGKEKIKEIENTLDSIL